MNKAELEQLKRVLLESIAVAFSSLETEEVAAPSKRGGPPKKEQNVREVSKANKKRGTPPKPKKLEPIVEIKGEFPIVKVGDLEEKVEDILSFEAPLADDSRKKSNYITVAKRVGVSAEVRSVGNLQEFKKDPNRKIKFIDDPSIGDKISPDKYPERGERRPPAQVGHFRCSVCNQEFEGSYGEFPQAISKFKDPQTGLEDQPYIRCNNCACRPIGGR